MIELLVKQWKNGEWYDRTVTFHRMNQEWQSDDGNLVIRVCDER